MPDDQLALVEDSIMTVRGQRVILSPDLARIYGVETRSLNQAVNRNKDRFPSDFAFRLTKEEAEETQRSRSQIVILNRGSNLKYPPIAFTEHGAVMAATVLNSPRAVQISKGIDPSRRRPALSPRPRGVRAAISIAGAPPEKRVGAHDQELRAIIEALRLLAEPPAKPHRRLGFPVSGDK